jgi:hypothetical protein
VDADLPGQAAFDEQKDDDVAYVRAEALVSLPREGTEQDREDAVQEALSARLPKWKDDRFWERFTDPPGKIFKNAVRDLLSVSRNKLRDILRLRTRERIRADSADPRLAVEMKLAAQEDTDSLRRAWHNEWVPMLKVVRVELADNADLSAESRADLVVAIDALLHLPPRKNPDLVKHIKNRLQQAGVPKDRFRDSYVKNVYTGLLAMISLRLSAQAKANRAD